MQFETFTPKGNVRGFIMPDFIFNDVNLCLGCKSLYAVLCTYAGDKDHCWPSHRTLADKLGVSVSTIKIYIEKLKKGKYIASTDVALNRVRSCLYYMLRPSASVQKTKTPTSSQNLTTPQSESGYNLNLKEINTNTPLPPKPTSTANTPSESFPNSRRGDFSIVNKIFEEFYSFYPKKEGKDIARSVFHSLYRKNGLPTLEVFKQAIAMAGLSVQWQKDNGRYIPMLSNFLRGKRWEEFQEQISQELVKKEEIQRRNAQFAQDEIKRNEAFEVQYKILRPLFDNLASKFMQGIRGPAFGLWNLLYEKGIAPTEQDVPSNSSELQFYNWLKEFQFKQLYV